MKKDNVNDIHSEIIGIINKRIEENAREIFISMASGTGKSKVIKKFAEQYNQKILIVVDRLEFERKYTDILKNNVNVSVKHYADLSSTSDYDYVIFNDTDKLSNDKYDEMCQYFDGAILIFFLSVPLEFFDEDRWITGKKIDYSFTALQAIENGYVSPKFESKFESLVLELLRKQKFDNIQEEVVISHGRSSCRLDFAFKNNGANVFVEVKNYRSKYVSFDTIERAVSQVERYRNLSAMSKKEDIIAVLIVSSLLTQEQKDYFYRSKQIIILDISNLLYLAKDDNNFLELLLSSIQYSVDGIIPSPPKYLFSLPISHENNVTDDMDEALGYIKKLETLKSGNSDKNDKEYEKLCENIIRYLFSSDFTMMKPQNATSDGMFVMDLVCGLKSKSEFWKIFIQHFNTRFVVFEFKNCKNKIDQNIVCVTEKYLCDAALRNVAIVVSRKGFSPNARRMATNILNRDKKLMLDVNDNDLVNMIRMKLDGEDPLDYMLDLLEEYLISIGI